MKTRLRSSFVASACAIAAVATLVPQSVAAQTVATGAFRNLEGIEKSLVRGATTKAQVRTQFGIPNGSGAARFFTLGGDQREIWYYEDIEATGTTSADQVMRLQMRQQLLIVMFKGELVDSYLWTSNSGTAEAK